MQPVRTAPLITLGNALSIITTAIATGVMLVTVTSYIGEIRAEMRITAATQGQRIDVLEQSQKQFAVQDKVDRELLWEIRGDLKHLRLLLDKTSPAQPPH